MIRFRMVSLLMLAVGVLLLLGGVGGFASLCIASWNYEHTTGVIRKYQTKRVHRFRKIRYESEMLVSYPTSKYGEMFVSRASYWPFRSEGDNCLYGIIRNIRGISVFRIPNVCFGDS